MNRQTARLAQQESMPKKRNTLLQHTAVRPVAEHPSPSNGTATGLGRDFTQVPVQPQAQTAGRNTARSCPMSPQRCPFGGACHACPPKMQAKLKIGQPGDRYEQEADRVAEQVMRMPEPQVQRKCSAPGCKDEDENKLVQAKSAGSAGNAQVDHPLIQSVLSSPGQPLDAGTRSFMEPRFGQDFSGVRVYTGGEAAESARAVNARAYTVGRDVVFGEGQYVPGSDEGRRLVAHELVHVGQQRNSKDQKIQCRHVLENDPATAPSMTCTIATSTPNGVSLDVTFGKNSDTLSDADKAAVSTFVRNWHLLAAEPVRVDGYASIDGPPSLNWPLSCRRAEILANELMMPSDGAQGISANYIELFAHGETDRFGTTLEHNRRAQAHIPSGFITPTQPSTPLGCFDSSMITVSKNGTTQSCAAFTSPSTPTPTGRFCIRRQGEAQRAGGIRGWFQDRTRWYLLEPQFPTTRSRMMLHRGTMSSGCITVKNSSCFSALESVLNSSGTVSGTGYDGYPPGNSDGVTNPPRTVDCVAWLNVMSSGSCPTAP